MIIYVENQKNGCVRTCVHTHTHRHTHTPLPTSPETKKQHMKVAEFKANRFPTGQQQTATIWHLKYSNIDPSTYSLKHLGINLTK